MTQSGEKGRYKIWLQQGYYDVEAAKNSFSKGHYEWTCYQSVQATEKILKAVLVHAGWSPPMTHKLGVLVSLCNKANKYFPDVKLHFRKLEAYTFVSRYPFVYPGQKNITPHDYITKQDGETCLEIAENVFNKVHEFLNDRATYPGEIINIDEYYFTAKEVQDRIDQVIRILSTAEEIKVNKLLLFGSFAREKTRPKTSTMDLIVIGETQLPFIDRIAYVRELTGGDEPIVEPLVYTEKEFDYMLNEEGEGYLESAIAEGRVIYKRSTLVTNL